MDLFCIRFPMESAFLTPWHNFSLRNSGMGFFPCYPSFMSWWRRGWIGDSRMLIMLHSCHALYTALSWIITLWISLVVLLFFHLSERPHYTVQLLIKKTVASPLFLQSLLSLFKKGILVTVLAYLLQLVLSSQPVGHSHFHSLLTF